MTAPGDLTRRAARAAALSLSGGEFFICSHCIWYALGEGEAVEWEGLGGSVGC